MSTILETLVTTLVSGGLTAGGAYFAVIWKLSHRLAVLETRVVQIDKTTDELKRTDDRLDQEQRALQLVISTSLLGLKDDIHAQISDLFKDLSTRLEANCGKLTDDLTDNRTSCIERTGQCVAKQSFETYAQEEERRWQEFYKVVGRLEAVIDRIFHGSGFPPSRLTGPQGPLSGPRNP